MNDSKLVWHKDPCTAKLILRLALGIGFVVHGWMKVSDLSATSAGFVQYFNLPGFMGPIVGFVELFAGIFVLLGIWTRYSALAIAVVMLGAIFLVKLKMGYLIMELDISYLAIALALAVIGPGRYSLSHKLAKNKN